MAYQVPEQDKWHDSTLLAYQVVKGVPSYELKKFVIKNKVIMSFGNVDTRIDNVEFAEYEVCAIIL